MTAAIGPQDLELLGQNLVDDCRIAGEQRIRPGIESLKRIRLGNLGLRLCHVARQSRSGSRDDKPERQVTPGGHCSSSLCCPVKEELTGRNLTDRGKAGTKYHVVVATDGLPLGVVPSAANVHDTRLLPHLLRLAQAVCAAIGRLYADAAYDSADNRRLCLDQGIQPDIRQIGEAHGSGLGRVRCVVEHDCAWLLANKRLDRRQDRLGRVILALLTAACIFIVANRIRASENRA